MTIAPATSAPAKGDILVCVDDLGTSLLKGKRYIVRKINNRSGRVYLKGVPFVAFSRRHFVRDQDHSEAA